MLTQDTYRKLIATHSGSDFAGIAKTLIPAWCEDYSFSNPSAEILEVETGTPGASFTYLFDLNLERAIAAYGIPSFAKHQRDKSRMAGHPLSAGSQFHRGHLMANSLGGGTDINLVPQLGKLNTGQFRILERHVLDLAKNNVQCFYFVRPIYTNRSQTPTLFEQCVILSSKSIAYALHQNS